MTDLQHEKVITPDSLPARFFFYNSSSQFVPSHWHNSVELLYMKSGLMDVGINSRTYSLKKGDLIVINSGDIHSTRCLNSSFVLALQIPYPLLKTHISEYHCVRFQMDDGSLILNQTSCYSGVRDILDELYVLTCSMPSGYTLRFSALIYDLVYRLSQSCITRVSSSARKKSDKNLDRLEQVTAYVKGHYTQPISLEDGASVLSLNPEYFCRYFKKHMGVTFLEYVNSIRLSHIHQDLLETDEAISVLLERHGFLNYRLFVRMFRNAYGCSPSALRREASLAAADVPAQALQANSRVE